MAEEDEEARPFIEPRTTDFDDPSLSTHLHGVPASAAGSQLIFDDDSAVSEKFAPRTRVVGSSASKMRSLEHLKSAFGRLDSVPGAERVYSALDAVSTVTGLISIERDAPELFEKLKKKGVYTMADLVGHYAKE